MLGTQLCDPRMHRCWVWKSCKRGSNEGILQNVECSQMVWKEKPAALTTKYHQEVFYQRGEELNKKLEENSICSCNFAEVKLGPRTPKLGGPLVHDSCTVVVHVPLCLDYILFIKQIMQKCLLTLKDSSFMEVDKNKAWITIHPCTHPLPCPELPLSIVAELPHSQPYAFSYIYISRCRYTLRKDYFHVTECILFVLFMLCFFPIQRCIWKTFLCQDTYISLIL